MSLPHTVRLSIEFEAPNLLEHPADTWHEQMVSESIQIGIRIDQIFCHAHLMANTACKPGNSSLCLLHHCIDMLSDLCVLLPWRRPSTLHWQSHNDKNEKEETEEKTDKTSQSLSKSFTQGRDTEDRRVWLHLHCYYSVIPLQPCTTSKQYSKQLGILVYLSVSDSIMGSCSPCESKVWSQLVDMATCSACLAPPPESESLPAHKFKTFRVDIKKCQCYR